MAVSLPELFRTLTSFSPARVDLRGAPWDAFCDWAIGQGLAPLAAYNLEYRLGAAEIPEWVRHRLLSLYQGSANDNVMKLVNLKRAIDDLEGRKIVLVGGASFAESLYPHVAFRPVIDVRLLVPPTDVEPLTTWLRRSEFKVVEGATDSGGAARVLSDTRTTIFVHGGLTHDAQENEAMLARTLPMRAFGPSARRLDLEDALLGHVLLMARAGFDVPMLEFIDLRELVLGAPSMGGVYARPIDRHALGARARAWKVERGLWCALSIVERLWPEAGGEGLKPEPQLPGARALERAIVRPLAEVGRVEGFRGAEALRSLLAGGLSYSAVGMSAAVEVPKPPLIVAAIRALRPRQWTKNGVLLVPLLFARGIFTHGLLPRALLSVAAFSLLASGVYVVNDWFDRDKDKLHPEKRKRPIAAGHLPGSAAIVVVLACWAGAGAIGWWLSPAFVAVLGGYLLLQVLYTGGLKHLVLLDIMAIALGFIIRVVAGATAIDVEVSNWLFLCTLLGALFLGFAKRRAELSALEDASAHRANLADYTVPMLDQMMSICAACSILGYGLYTVSKETVDHVGTDRLKFTVPCVVYGVFRYLFLVHRRGAGGAPEKVLLGDVPLLVDIGLFMAIAGWALYAVQ